MSAILHMAFWVAVIGGWIANVVKLIGLLDGSVSGWLLFRLLGVVVFPLGAVLGYC